VTGTSREGGALAQLDVTDPASVAAFAQALEGRAVDLLVCNAGVYLDKHETLTKGYPAQMWADTFAANVTGVFLSVQALLPNLQAAQAGKIAIISSQMASHTRAPGGSYVYRASKAAALNLGRNLAADLAPLQIAVGIYHPGWVRTDMGGDAADISVDESATGLMARFAELGPDTTGCFLTWDGRPHPY
jgi:NAD(P)-dependent dehydrogenase (short-subunit alcohol dehydrogenase family)